MNIVLYVPLLTKTPKSNFIVGTFFPLFKHFKDQKIFLITDDPELSIPDLEIITIKPQPKNILLKKLWIDKVLTSQLRKIGADVFISADNFCLLKSTLPQLILIPDLERLKLSYTKKAELIVMSETDKQDWLNQMNHDTNTITVVYPSPEKTFFPIDDDEKRSIREKYSGDKEYFLASAYFQKKEEFIDLLKSFSHFKKRQQSSFKLLLFIDSGIFIEKEVENYKYRNDIFIIRSNNEEEKTAITAAAYAMIFPFSKNIDMIGILNAMQSGIPILATKNQKVSEIARDVVLYAENDIKDLGEKMMQLYRDETLRSQLIERGKEKVKEYSEEKSAAQLWQAIMKVTN